jgi:phosphate transport system substrate-binding protein
MRRMNKKWIALLIVSILALTTMTACGTTATTTTATTTAGSTTAATTAGTTAATTTEAKLSGSVIIDGSGTVYPLMAHIAESYMTNVQQDVSVEVGRAGSSAGFKKFIPGELDLSDASRAIKQEEIDQLTANGINYETDVLEIKLALDGLTIVINKENTWAVEMTKDEIVNMYLSGKFKADDKVLWSDVRTGWPSEEVKFYGPNENHGTYEFFFDNILKKAEMVKTVNLQQEYSTLVDLVSKDKNAIAFFGFGYYVSNKDKLTAVKVDFGSGPVEPTLETIGETLPYAGFTRPVFTYLNLNYAKSKPQVLDFAKYIVTYGAPELAGENGFAPLPDEQYKAILDKLDAIG